MIMTENKKFYLIGREDTLEDNGKDSNVWICDTYEVARELFDNMVQEYLKGYFKNRVDFDTFEALTDEVIVRTDTEGIRFVYCEEKDTQLYCHVWMDEEPREVITENTRGKSSLW